MIVFGRPKRRPVGKASSSTSRPPAVLERSPPPRQPEDRHDTSLPPRYSRIDFPENLPFAAFSRNDASRYEPATVPQYPPRPPQRPPAIEPRAQSSPDLWGTFDNALQTATTEVVRQQQSPPGFVNDGPALCDLISSKFNAVITSIDGETFSGDEQELHVCENPQLRGGWGRREVSRGANDAISSAIISTNYFKKASLYANSRLPPDLPTLKLFLPSYPVICLAAQYSQRVYTKPAGEEREAHIEADWRVGTKATVIKSTPIKEANCIVFAIRGSQTFMDWVVNLNSAPASPADFLDDPGNYVHSGFLSVARKMIKPVAARLRSLLQDDPSHATCSLVMTGHSAGGAVASLLYSHMLAEVVKSELNTLSGCFKRIHCITFGAPPLSLLPLNKSSNPRFRKSLFLSFINEGDPVPRADKAYIRSLIDLYTSPSPNRAISSNALPSIHKLPALKSCKRKQPRRPKLVRATSAPSSTPLVCQAPAPAPPAPSLPPVWKVPPGTLSNAGRLVVLRVPDGPSRASPQRSQGAGDTDDVRAEYTCDQELRTVVFGDPMMHIMKTYARRVEVLATKAVTAQIWG